MKKTLKMIKPYWPLLAAIILLTSLIATAFQTDEAVSLPKEVAENGSRLPQDMPIGFSGWKTG